MLRKKVFLSLLTLFLFTGAALAQNDTASDDDSMDDAEQECYREYQDDLADADDEDESEQRERERAEAKEDYEDCLADAQREREHDDDDEMEREHDEDESDDDSEHLPVPDNYTGDHIAFRVTDDGIADYTVQDALIFSAAYGEGSADWDEFKVEGSSLELEGSDDTEAKISDSPTGVFRFEVDDHEYVTIEFPSGYRITDRFDRMAMDDDFEDDDSMDDRRMDDRMSNMSDDHPEGETEREREMDRYEYRNGHGKHHLILTGPDNLTAHLYVEDGYTYDNGTLTSPEEVRLVVANAPGLQERHHERTIEGIANGRIAAEVELRRDGRFSDAEFGDVNVTVERTGNGFIAHVDRNDPEGRTILFSLEQDALGDLGALQVLFDGEPIGLADDAEDVLDTSDGVAEYLILVGGEGAEVLVQVPHFSPHTIELSAAQPTAAIPGPSAGLVMVSVLGLAAAIQAVRRH